MPTVYMPGLVQIRPQYYTEAADIAENILWYLGGGTPPYTLSQLLNLQSVFDTNWQEVFQAYAATPCTYAGSIITDWSNSAGLQTPVSAVDIAGTKGNPIGANTAVLVSLRSPRRYKGGHARVYLPCVGITSTASSSTIQAPVVTNTYDAIQNTNTALAAISGANGGPFNREIFRFRNDPAKAFIEIPTEFSVQTVMASQRRRLRKAAHT